MTQKLFVIPHGSGWCVKKQGAKRSLMKSKYREIVFLRACQEAWPNQVVVVMNKNGEVDFTFEVE